MGRLSHSDQPYQTIIAKLAKFSVVGLSGVGVNSGLLYLLHATLRFPLLAASVVAVEAAIVSNFYLNAHWTFHDTTPSILRFARFNLVSLGGMIITVATLQSLVSLTGIQYMVANLIGISLATIWNFLLNLLWTWERND